MLQKRMLSILCCSMMMVALLPIGCIGGAFAADANVIGQTLDITLNRQANSSTAYPFQSGEPGNYTSGNFFNLVQDGSLKYQLHQPAKPEKGKKYPIYFFFHGSGAYEEIEKYPQLGSLGWTERLISKINSDPADYEAYVVMPIITGWGPDPQTVMHIIERLVQDEAADSDRIYVTGLSMGGYATSDFIMAYPDVAAAAVLLCGAYDLPPQKALELVNLPIRLYHSSDDPTVSVNASRKFNKTLLDAGGDKSEYYEVTGYGHAVWNYAYRTDMLEWIFSQNKNPLLRNEALLADFRPDEQFEKADIDVPGVYVYSTQRGDTWSGANIMLGSNAGEWPWSIAVGDDRGESDGSVAFIPVKNERYRLSVNYTSLGTVGLRVRWIKDNTNGSYTAMDNQVVKTPPYDASLSPNDVATRVPAHFNSGMEAGGTYTLVIEIKMDGSLPAENLVGNIAIRGSYGGNDFEINWIKIEKVGTGDVLVDWDANAAPATSSAPNLDTAHDWARDDIKSAVSKGFVPQDLQSNYANVITRAEFCRMAVKWVEYKTGKKIDAVLAEKGVSRDPNAFSDTKDIDIFAAYALGIINGTTEPTAKTPGKFTPNGEFNREQAATMIRNTCKAAGMDVSNVTPAGFTDIGTASSWAVDSINFCCDGGIIQGTSTSPKRFSPKAKYTREQSIMTFNSIK